MRVLVLGAGGTGGYFGGRLFEAGCDVTFLVRPARAQLLRSHGLVIRSPLGDARLAVPAITSETLSADYDLVLLSCKAYDLADAVQTLAPAIRPGVTVLPLLNGLAHFDVLDSAFGAAQVLGGMCHISATLNAEGEIEHLNSLHSLAFGEREAAAEPLRCERIAATFARAHFKSHHSANITGDLWDKFAFMAACASLTCLMRANVADIIATPEGEQVARRLVAECADIARASGYPASPKGTGFTTRMLLTKDSTLKASMLRDIEAGRRVEADHLVGDMLRRGHHLNLPTDMLQAAYAHLKAYERVSGF